MNPNPFYAADIVPHSEAATPETTRPDPLEMLLADKRSAQTRRAYRLDLTDFFGGEPTPAQVRDFLILPTPEVALRLAMFKARLMSEGKAEATVNRRLAAVRSLLKMAHRLGFAQTDGRGLIDGERVRSYRDTRGISLEMMRVLLQAPGTQTLGGKRDTALLRLLCENALRRAEVCALSVADFAPEAKRLSIIGKGRGTQKQPITLSARCIEDIAAYLHAAGHAEMPVAPLFRNLDPRPEHHGRRLTIDGVYHLIELYGQKIGVPLSPHKLRHSAITAALDATGGDLRRVQKLSRHANLNTLLIYDDNRADFQGEVTTLLSDLL